jgi:hypothetical protein
VKKPANQAEYDATIEKFKSYFIIQGLFEEKLGQEYSPYNGINKDYEWKSFESTIETNSHHLKELKFNLTDVALLGTSETIDPIKEVISTFRITFNQ